jgi:hypothetical protein
MANLPRYRGGQHSPPPATPDAQPPATIVNAVKLMYLGAAVSIVSLIISLATAGGLKSAIRKAQPKLTPTQVNNTATAIITAAVIFGLLGAALWLWMAWANKRGRSWARIVSSVFFGIATLSAVTSITRPGDLLTRVITVVIWVIGVAAIVLLWRPESSAYYQAASGLGRAENTT